MTTPHLSPTSETAMAAAREIAAQYLHKDAAEKAVIYAAIIARHFRPLLAKVEAENQSLNRLLRDHEQLNKERQEWALKNSDTITTLRADLAEAKAERDEKQSELQALYDHHKITEQIIIDAQGQRPETGKALLWTLDTLKADLAAKGEALQDFAKQKTTSELVRDDVECPDFEGAYDHMIHVARTALASRADKGGAT